MTLGGLSRPLLVPIPADYNGKPCAMRMALDTMASQSQIGINGDTYVGAGVEVGQESSSLSFTR